MSWRVKLLVLMIIGAFVAFAFYYHKLFVSPQKHGIILFVVPGLSAELISKAETYSADRYLKSLTSADQMLWVRTTTPASNTPDLSSLMTYVASAFPSMPHQLGLSLSGEKLDTLFYQARRNGRSLGMVSTTTFTSPTVAAFFSHVLDDRDQASIATHLLDSVDLQLAMTGGGKLFDEVLKEKERDLLQEARLKDIQVVHFREDFDSLQAWRRRPILGVFSREDMPFHRDQQEADQQWMPPSLHLMTQFAVQKLQYHFGGYFLVIGHELLWKAKKHKDPQYALEELLELDRAVHKALSYAGDNTVVMVYAPFQDEAGQAFGFLLVWGQQYSWVQSTVDAGTLHSLIKSEL